MRRSFTALALMSRVADVRPAAQIDELALAIEAHLNRRFRRRLAVLVHLARGRGPTQIPPCMAVRRKIQRPADRQGRVLEGRIRAKFASAPDAPKIRREGARFAALVQTRSKS